MKHQVAMLPAVNAGLLLLRILGRLGVLGIRLRIRIGRILTGLLTHGILSRLANRLTDWLPNGLATETGSCLHAGLAHAKRILGRIPDELEETVIFGLVVDHDGFLVDLAADANDVAPHDRGRVVGGNGSVRTRACRLIGGNGGARGGCRILGIGRIGPRIWQGSRLRSWLALRIVECAYLPNCLPQHGPETTVRSAGPGHGSNGCTHSGRDLAKLDVRSGRLQTADELASGANINKPPRTILRV